MLKEPQNYNLKLLQFEWLLVQQIIPSYEAFCKINEIFRFAVFGGDMSQLERTHVHVASLNGGNGC